MLLLAHLGSLSTPTIQVAAAVPFPTCSVPVQRPVSFATTWESTCECVGVGSRWYGGKCGQVCVSHTRARAHTDTDLMPGVMVAVMVAGYERRMGVLSRYEM